MSQEDEKLFKALVNIIIKDNLLRGGQNVRTIF